VAKFGFDLKLNDSDFRRLSSTTAEKAEAGIKQTALLVEAEAVRRAPHRTDNLLNSATTSWSGGGFDTVAQVRFTAPYALYVHEGTGIFGPEGRPIEPVNAKALAFFIGSNLVFAKSVKGQKGQPFLKEAFEEEGPKLISRILK
jgi:hypothetical protein